MPNVDVICLINEIAMVAVMVMYVLLRFSVSKLMVGFMVARSVER